MLVLSNSETDSSVLIPLESAKWPVLGHAGHEVATSSKVQQLFGARILGTVSTTLHNQKDVQFYACEIGSKAEVTQTCWQDNVNTDSGT